MVPLVGEGENMKIGRNDPCPCGSGKKYKKCCLGKDDDAHYNGISKSLVRFGHRTTSNFAFTALIKEACVFSFLVSAAITSSSMLSLATILWCIF